MTKQMPIRIVFFDIDGTLYRKETDTLPESVAEAIRGLHAHGVIPAIATGRTFAALPDKIYPLIEQEGIDVLVTINGQHNSHKGSILSSHPIPVADLDTVVATLKQSGHPYAMVSDRAIAVSEETPVIARALAHIGHYVLDPDYHHRHPVYQMLIFCHSGDEDAVIKSMPDGYRTIRWHDECIDLLPNDASKSRGIEAVCRELGINMKHVMVFGDAINDIEMLHIAGVGMAMGDACDELKAVADDHTERLEDDGIINALRRYGLVD